MPGEDRRYPQYGIRSPRLRPGRTSVMVAPGIRGLPHLLLGFSCSSSRRTASATSEPLLPTGVGFVSRLCILGSPLGRAHTLWKFEANAGLPDHNARHVFAPEHFFGPRMHSHGRLTNRHRPSMEPSCSGTHRTPVWLTLGTSPLITLGCPQALPVCPPRFLSLPRRFRPPRSPQAMPTSAPSCHVPTGTRSFLFDDPSCAIAATLGAHHIQVHRCHLPVVWSRTAICSWSHHCIHMRGCLSNRIPSCYHFPVSVIRSHCPAHSSDRAQAATCATHSGQVKPHHGRYGTRSAVAPSLAPGLCLPDRLPILPVGERGSRGSVLGLGRAQQRPQPPLHRLPPSGRAYPAAIPRLAPLASSRRTRRPTTPSKGPAPRSTCW